MEILRTASLASNFIGSYKNRACKMSLNYEMSLNYDSNKYFSIPKQRLEEETIWKVFKLILCCGKFKQIRSDVFGNVKIRYNF